MSTSQIEGYVSKYMGILGTKAPRPIIKLSARIGSKWLGRCHWKESQILMMVKGQSLADLPEGRFRELLGTSTITILKQVLSDPKTLERIVAHEMIHHHDFMTMNKIDLTLIRRGIKSDGHGEDFLAAANKINEIMGKDFVTKVSDQEYVLTNNKKFFVYIEPWAEGIYGFIWGVRLSEDSMRWIAQRIRDKGGKLIETTDIQWTYCKGKLGRTYKGICIPRKEDARQGMLKALYEGGSNVKLLPVLPAAPAGLRPF